MKHTIMYKQYQQCQRGYRSTGKVHVCRSRYKQYTSIDLNMPKLKKKLKIHAQSYSYNYAYRLISLFSYKL